jgi:hypothetical protein
LSFGAPPSQRTLARTGLIVAHGRNGSLETRAELCYDQFAGNALFTQVAFQGIMHASGKRP